MTFFQRTEQTKPVATYPQVSIIISAFNEEDIIKERINNCNNLDYPDKNVEIIIGSDGSTDQTVDIAKSIESGNIKVLDFPVNRGRSQVHNDCVKKAYGEILLFTDADTKYKADYLKKLVPHYRDEEVGAVGGELRSESFDGKEIGEGQGIYWQWEYSLRRLQSKLGVLFKVSGANMSIRKDLFQSLPDDIDIDQAAGPMVLQQGKRVKHESKAIAYEEFPTKISGEFSTRRRLTVRALTALWHFRGLLNPLKHPWLSFNWASYRLLRYLIPFFLLGLLITNGFLINRGWFFTGIFAIQVLGYLSALIGYLLQRSDKDPGIFKWPFVYVLFNLGILVGDLEFLFGKRVFAYQSVDD